MSQQPSIIHLDSTDPWQTTDPLPYTSNPWALLVSDLVLFFQQSPYIIWTVLPLSWKSPIDELYPSLANLWCVAVHSVLAVAQLLFLLSVPLAILFPVPFSPGLLVFYIAGFFLFNHFLCLVLLNGSKSTLQSRADLSHFPAHPDEKWIFLNGVAAGHVWLQANIDRIAMSFGRPVTGIHNPTAGIPFDILQCLVQRDFTFATPDVRHAYAQVKEALCDDKFKRVIFILHSQGGIEGGLVLDWLFAGVPNQLLRKLEVYTFGCAANHFNDPKLFSPSAPASPAKGSPNVASLVTQSSSRQPSLTSPPDYGVCRYIEHYAHTREFVARWGVLHFDSWYTEAGKGNRYRGRVFERYAKGHLFNQHYMNNIFPLDTKRGWGILDKNSFMDAFASVAEWGVIAQENPSPSKVLVRNLTFPLKAYQARSSKRSFETAVKTKDRVGDFSRLWHYRNGRSVND